MGSPERFAGFSPRTGNVAPPPARDIASDLLADPSDSHVMVVAPTGSGKGRGVIIPNLLEWPGPAIVVDVKGEAAATTARYRRERLGQKTVVLDPFKRASRGEDGLNPLDWLRIHKDYLADNAMMLAAAMGDGSRGTKEPFWDEHADDLIAGLVVLAATDADPAKRHLGYVWDLLTDDDLVYTLGTQMDFPSLHPFARQQLSSYLAHESEKVRPSVRSTALQHMRILGSASVRQTLSKTTFDLSDVGHGEPMTIYLVVPPSKLASHGAMLRLWLTVLAGIVAERNYAPPMPTLLIVDELAQLGRVPIVLQAVTLMRGYGLRVMLFLQSLAQLRALWPEQHHAVSENCGTLLTFGHTRQSQSRDLAELLGDVSARSLFEMPADCIAVNRAGCGTVFARRLDYLEDPLFKDRADPNPLFQPAPLPTEPEDAGWEQLKLLDD